MQNPKLMKLLEAFHPLVGDACALKMERTEIVQSIEILDTRIGDVCDYVLRITWSFPDGDLET
jgi:hypothetical protein